MSGRNFQRAGKGRLGLLESSLPAVNGTERVPRVRGAFASVDLVATGERQFPRKRINGSAEIVLRSQDKTRQQVEAHCRERAGDSGLGILRGAAFAKHIERAVERSSRYEHGRDQPVAERHPRAEPEHCSCGPDPVLSPADEAQSEPMMPVVWFEFDGSL